MKKVLIIMCLMVASNSCTQEKESMSPGSRVAGARSGVSPNAQDCPEGYHPVYSNGELQCVPDETAVDCSQIQNVQSTQRAKAVAQYGEDGGTRFDQLAADPNPDATINNFSAAVYGYKQQLEQAVGNAAFIYANHFGSCDTCIDNYSSTAFLYEVQNQVTPVKNTITNDASLTDVQRSMLLKAIQAIYDNWDDIGRLVEKHDSCFPNPAWYNSGSGNGVVTNGFFSGFVKVLKKVVNIVASVVVNVIKYALDGAIIGSLFSCAGQPELSIVCAEPGLSTGAILGGLFGLARGIIRVAQGTYDGCIFPPCS